MSDAVYDLTPATPNIAAPPPPAQDDERPPACPSCNRRLVILATHWTRDDGGQQVRRQLWGCPRGHATAHRVRGAFTPIELLEDVS